MTTPKLSPGTPFPAMQVTTSTDEVVRLDQPREDSGCDWQMIVVYRGRHCPICTQFLNHLAQSTHEFQEAKVDIIAVSGDSKAQLEENLQHLYINFPIAYGLTQLQMQVLGLYISKPRSKEESDHNFAEPGLFIVNDEGILLAVDIGNNPFCRPNIETLLHGIQWIRQPDNNYPIRGTLAY